MKRLALSCLAFLIGCLCFTVPTAFGQGCVAVRGGSVCPIHSGATIGGAHAGDGALGYMDSGEWQVTAGYRWLYSDRHFRGSHEEPHRQEAGTEVINASHFLDLSVLYAFNPRWSAALTLPLAYHKRSSLYEHPGAGRHVSRARGLGDVRVTGYWWAVAPESMPRGNLSLGLGIKLPTGKYDATDTFHTAAGPVTGTVDQSIQPGDGGYGFTAEFFGFIALFERTSAYAQGFYLFNPENVSGASTVTGRPRSNPHEQIMSIPDQYMLRAGLSYLFIPAYGMTFNLGGRIEGVPVRDVFGRNDGFRRPGYAVSVEPGVSLELRQWLLDASVPIAVYRNRTQSVPDKRWTEETGIYRHGDAAFADFVVTLTVARRF